MRKRLNMPLFFAVAILIGSFALAGCPKRPEVIVAPPAPVGPAAAVAPAPPPPAPAPTPPPAPAPAPVVVTPVAPPPPAPAEAPATPPPPPPAAVPAPSPLRDVFFNYNAAGVREDQKAALNDNVGWLKANTGAKILIEGHCDERGTAEYNLALGERRAKAAKDYLVGAGIAAERVSIISYGKERPFVLGKDESAWKWNRRAHFVLQGQ